MACPSKELVFKKSRDIKRVLHSNVWCFMSKNCFQDCWWPEVIGERGSIWLNCIQLIITKVDNRHWMPSPPHWLRQLSAHVVPNLIVTWSWGKRLGWSLHQIGWYEGSRKNCRKTTGKVLVYSKNQGLWDVFDGLGKLWWVFGTKLYMLTMIIRIIALCRTPRHQGFRIHPETCILWQRWIVKCSWYFGWMQKHSDDPWRSLTLF